MTLNNYKMLVSDLDGTLVPFGSDYISPLARETVLSLIQSDLIFTIATGRSWEQTKKLVNELEIQTPVIVQTGALIIDSLKEKTIRGQVLRPSIDSQLRYIAKGLSVDQLCLNSDGVYCGVQITKRSGNWLLQSGETLIISDTKADNRQIIKHLFIGTEKELKQIIERIEHLVKPRPNMILWPPDLVTEDWFLEVFDPLASKGQALSWLIQSLHVQPEEVIAFGDGLNDLDMLRLAGLGIAVETAPAEIKSVAQLTIAGPENDGIAKFLIHQFKCNIQTA